MIIEKKKTQLQIVENIEKLEIIYKDLFELFYQKTTNRIKEILDYYGELDKYHYFTDFIKIELPLLKNKSKYKRILNNIIDTVDYIGNDNVINQILDEQINENNNINFDDLIGSFISELMSKLNLDKKVEKDIIESYINNIKVIESDLQYQNNNTIKIFQNLFLEIKKNNKNYQQIISNMNPLEAINYLNFTLSELNYDDARKLIEELLQSDINSDIKNFLNSKISESTSPVK